MPTTLRAALTALMLLPAGAKAQHADHAATGAAHAQLDAVRAATERYRDHAAAVADGYVAFGREGPLMGEHWYRRDLVDAPLDLRRPSTLQYALVAGERVLVGVAYTLYRRPDAPLPEGFAGDADHWHVHDVNRIARSLAEDRPLLRRVVERRAARGALGAGEGRSALTMLHAWVWSDNPDGVFALEHRALPYLRAGLPATWAADATADAAWGVALLDDRTCGWELNRIALLARPDGAQRAALEAACAAAGAEVAAARSATSATYLNRAAERAWRRYAAARDALLTDEQHARLNVMIEH